MRKFPARLCPRIVAAQNRIFLKSVHGNALFHGLSGFSGAADGKICAVKRAYRLADGLIAGKNARHGMVIVAGIVHV
jgi:hypothetical protein